jgi:hypothetical protein
MMIERAAIAMQSDAYIHGIHIYEGRILTRVRMPSYNVRLDMMQGTQSPREMVEDVLRYRQQWAETAQWTGQSVHQGGVCYASGDERQRSVKKPGPLM